MIFSQYFIKDVWLIFAARNPDVEISISRAFQH